MDREERLVFVRRLPANRPFTGGFSFLFKKIKTAIDFSRRFAIIILPSAPKRGSHGRCAWTGVEPMAFRVGPPTKPLVTTGGFSLLRDVTLLCYGAVKSFGFSGFPCRGRKLPFSLISGAETRKISGA